jgi:hypothetical protein
MTENSLPRSYDNFRQTISDMNTGVIKPRYLGGGSESQVFEATLDDGRYAVKFANRYTVLDRPRNTAAATQRKIDAGLRGLGIAGLEQIATASIEDSVAVYNLVEGKIVKLMTDEDLQKVTETQMLSFYDSIDRAIEAGIEFDPWNQDGSNVIYSPDAGFTLIDYFVDYAKISPEESKLNGFRALGAAAAKLVGIFGER